MSIEEVSDLMDLFEYDDFVSYHEQTYQFTEECKISTESGLPLSDELSKSLKKNESPVSEQSSSGFVRASELFLRIDTNTTGESTKDESGEHLCVTRECQNTVPKKLKYCANQVECVELRYENELIDPHDEPNSDLIQSTCRQANNIENDYKDLHLEGINSLLILV